MTRFARERRVYFFEEPLACDGEPRLEAKRVRGGPLVLTPHLPANMAARDAEHAQREMLQAVLAAEGARDPLLWFYTPMALPVAAGVRPAAVVYDCMDELSLFKGAPPMLLEREDELLRGADLVFTGGHSLWEAKRHRHPRVHPFPSSVDVPHFARARQVRRDPADQARIPGPRVGFFGVVDERMDLELVEGVARARPDWQLLVIGPVVKIDPAALPRLPNVHWLGSKSYEDLPAYLSGWDVAIMPFARNEATRFISPTKTPEYLAAGRPVVSTSIRDVVRPYGDEGLVRIADDVRGFVDAIEQSLRHDRGAWLPRVDAFLANTSWDATFAGMRRLVEEASRARAPRTTQDVPAV
jgi:UDP-galactopyranose mutase